jgi:hypothetical protein
MHGEQGRETGGRALERSVRQRGLERFEVEDMLATYRKLDPSLAQ